MRKLTANEIDSERNPGYTRIYKVLAKFQVAAADKGGVKSILETFAQKHGGVELVEMQAEKISHSKVRPEQAKTSIKGKKFDRQGILLSPVKPIEDLAGADAGRVSIEEMKKRLDKMRSEDRY